MPPLKPEVILLHHHTTNPHRPILIPAMGLLGLADYLDRHGIHCQAVNLGVEQAVDPSFSFVDYVARAKAKVVGFSVHWFFQLPDSLTVAQALKRACPDVRVVFGGYSASLFAADIVQQFGFVDAVVRGDGEVPLLELSRVYLGRGERDLDAIPNLVYRSTDGSTRQTPFAHQISEAELAELCFTNMALLKNQEAFFKMEYYPTQRFKERFNLKNEGVLALERGRGCPFACTLCGGNREAQRIIFNRPQPIFQPPEAVLANIRKAMSFGYRNFYLCFDPDPTGPYYHDLFRRIRKERLPIRFMFESWGLPTERFVDDFADTFGDGIIVVSPDSGDETVRAKNKGVLYFSNEELKERVQQIERRGLVCHLFFGYLLPGDTRETVMKTRRFAADYQGDNREVFHLAFSTDPCSLVHLHPEEHDVHLSQRTMGDYLEALARKRLSPNLMTHRPKSMKEGEANSLIQFFAIEQLLRKVIPASFEVLGALAADRSNLHDTVESLCTYLAGNLPAKAEELSVTELVGQARLFLRAQFEGDLGAALVELIDYESTPYQLLEEYFSGMGLHYTSRCTKLKLDRAAAEALVQADSTVTTRRRYAYDVAALLGDTQDGRAPQVRQRLHEVTFAVDETGRFCAVEAGDGHGVQN